MDELKCINYLSNTIKTSKDVVKGIGDDAAVIKYTRDKYLLFASDMLVQGVHFTKGTDPFAIGWKAVAVNISDIAAMGGVAKYVVISVGVPKKTDPKYLKRILEGAKKICKKFGVSIVGGDTNASRVIVIDVSIIGEVEKRNITRRDTARVSDLIFITGCLGEGKTKHLKFVPRLEEARILVKKFKIHSMIDISDGLFIDLTRLCQASKVGAVLYKSLIPISQDKTADVRRKLEYGEDFELLFTLSISEARRLIKYVGRKGYPQIALVGEIVSKNKGLNFIVDATKVEKIKPRGYMHF